MDETCVHGSFDVSDDSIHDFFASTSRWQRLIIIDDDDEEVFLPNSYVHPLQVVSEHRQLSERHKFSKLWEVAQRENNSESTSRLYGAVDYTPCRKVLVMPGPTLNSSVMTSGLNEKWISYANRFYANFLKLINPYFILTKLTFGRTLLQNCAVYRHITQNSTPLRWFGQRLRMLLPRKV
jgi:hypothetical protein